jgi:beta-hydroxyacyl-ACP dehydratase FabZ
VTPSSSSAGAKGLDLDAILRLLPHRFPFLLVDRVLELENDRVLTIKNVTANEPFFPGHFPQRPVMPGVLILEAMAQSAGILALASEPQNSSKALVLTGIDHARFRRVVVPGDQLLIEVRLVKFRRPLWKMRGEARVGGELAAESQLAAMEIGEQRP